MSAKLVIVDSQVEAIVEDCSITVEMGDCGPQGPPGPRGAQFLSGDIDPTANVGLIGDQYLNTSTFALFGPKTGSGWGDGVSLFNPSLYGEAYIQPSPSSEWNISHNLGFIPNIIIVDSEGIVIEGDYKYINNNQIRATFSQPISGAAYLS